jgi:hypothetical protein
VKNNEPSDLDLVLGTISIAVLFAILWTLAAIL